MNEILVLQREESNEKIRISISHRRLWEEFHRNNNEMILTSKGRCIYPRIGYTVEGLEPKTMYLVCLKLSRTDRSRYKYTAGEWHTASTGDPESEARCIYPDNGSTHIGQYWTNNGIRFGKLKITNSAKDCSSNVLLTSMHKYRPVLYIYKVYPTPALCLDGSTILTNQYQLVKSFSDQIMEFIAVTAYQNQRIIEMKKIHNSYARGQRGGTIKGSNDTVASLGDNHSLQLSSSPLSRYKPYWSNGSHHFLNERYISKIQLQPSNFRSSVSCPIHPGSSHSNNSNHASPPNHQNSSVNSSSSLNHLNDSGSTLHTVDSIQHSPFSSLQNPPATIEHCSFLNSSGFTRFNLPNMWNYSTLWHHFSVPYPSFVPHSSQ